ncbi:hypothetical protein PASE110613_00175 [Paenibacillus sediminis]|uniref:Transposase DDE domain-containing protein n=1 Tax=Paenibacillus sediminis TaxID=664909 RepID=A0ABS4H0F9_9BACL|nr:hypothetical protein [Paenibacillus sediminis]
MKFDEHTEQMAFQETEYFKEKSKERYKIEAKNSELKHGHGYDVATSSGLFGMEMQGAMTKFAVNLRKWRWMFFLRLVRDSRRKHVSSSVASTPFRYFFSSTSYIASIVIFYQ